MGAIEIAKAEPKDARAVVEIFTRARAEMMYLPVVHSAAETDGFFTAMVRAGDIWIAKLDATVAGFMEIKGGWLHHLYVAPDFQNRGIGKALLDKAKQESREGIALWVFEDNTDAMRFYEREGFSLQEKRTKAQATNEENLPDRKYIWS